MRDINVELHEDHKKVQRLLQRLTWETDKYRWKELVAELSQDITAHMEAEEEAVYSLLLEVKATRPVARHSMQEHVEIKKCLRRLQKAEPDTNAAIESFAGLRYLFIEHATEEEASLFPLIEESFDDDEKENMYRNFCNARDRIKSEWVSAPAFPQPSVAGSWSPRLREIR